MAFNFVHKRNVIVIGRTGSGKSTLINQIVGQKVLEERFSFSSVTKEIEQIQGTLEIDSKKYEVCFIDTVGVHDGTSSNQKSNAQIISDIKTAITERITSGVNLILVTLNLLQLSPQDKEMFTMFRSNFKPAFWKLAVLVFTHCDLLNERAIKQRIQDFKYNEETKEIAQSFGDQIITVGFPSLDDIKEEHKQTRLEEMKVDVGKLHDALKEANSAELPKNIAVSDWSCNVS